MSCSAVNPSVGVLRGRRRPKCGARVHLPFSHGKYDPSGLSAANWVALHQLKDVQSGALDGSRHFWAQPCLKAYGFCDGDS